MSIQHSYQYSVLLVIIVLFCSACGSPPTERVSDTTQFIEEQTVTHTIESLVATHGEEQRMRIERGVSQAAQRWHEQDGSQEEFTEFCLNHFISDSEHLDRTFERFEQNLMLIGGYLMEMRRDLMLPLHLDTGPILPVDHLFGQFSPAVHSADDMFKTKLAFVALLNFPLTTLQERLEQGATWTRRQWAETRLAQRFDSRVPAHARQAATTAYTTSDSYINDYNIHMHRVLDKEGRRLFPENLILISHWGLRDELKAQYDLTEGLDRQRLIYTIMNRIIFQEIPKDVIDNPEIDWYVEDNLIVRADGLRDEAAEGKREADTRYEMWLRVFNGERAIDPYKPDNPTHIARRFNENREMPEEEVEQLLLSVLSSPLVKETAELIRQNLGRELEPFDIWYTGFKPKPPLTERQLDDIVRRKYPSTRDFERDLPNILRKLGFDADLAKFLADHIVVDASRGAGHAMGAGRLTDKARLRTRVPRDGMNYKGYNIAMHELGHNVEQILSFQKIDHTLLRGVPNTAFTEGFAFVFQARDLELLGLGSSDPLAEAMKTLDVLWSTYEIGGVALVDMRAWRWLYEHPDAEASQFREAVIEIANDVWNTYFAPVLGMENVPLLSIYSHMIDAGLYTPDYPLGHIIAFQVEQHLKHGSLAREMQRMCAIGNVTPDHWMKTAVGTPVSTQPLLDAAAEALRVLKQ